MKKFFLILSSFFLLISCNKDLKPNIIWINEKLRDTIAIEPLVAQILDIFPGASIDEIKNPEATDAAVTLVDDNGLLAAEQNNDDGEEVSR